MIRRLLSRTERGLAVLIILLSVAASCPAANQPGPLVDTDKDGFEDVFEPTLGTNPRAVDTDGDTLTDYDEYCKYGTDPTKADSDGDGLKDNQADERREYRYSVKAVCEIRPPCDPSTMTDLFQDLRLLDRRGHLPDSRIVEIVAYPYSRPHVCPGPYKPDQPLPKELQPYIEPTLAMNYSPEMKAEVRRIVKDAGTDVEAAQMIVDWIAKNTNLANTEPEFAYFCITDNRVLWHHSMDTPEAGEKLLNTNFYGDAMFKARLHGTCTSLATLRGTMLRAAGLPTRLIQTLPLITRCEGDPEPLVDKMRKRNWAQGYDLGPTKGGANHAYNEVFLGNHWVRVDDVVGRGTVVAGKLFVKAFSVPDWNNVFRPRPDEEYWNDRRDLRPLEVEDLLPRYRPKWDVVDVAVRGVDLVAAGPGRWRAIVEIMNQGTVMSPEFSVRFYAGDPEKKGRLLATHGAGPIMPGQSWGEGDGGLELKEAEDRIYVVLDEEGEVADTVRSNNKAFAVIPAADTGVGNAQSTKP